MYEVEIGETERFRIDCGLYGLEAERYEQALRILRSDPVIGKQRPDSPALWDWSFRSLRITYALSDQIDRIVLLRVVPLESPVARPIQAVLKAIRVINDVKRLFGL
ncbi:hypothetical protein GTW51_02310 [Aurantimonas aggregata]|uniref:Type II toxin-antitoxin system RelE/ParE family toxin n=1 Tax=Aurantimonas aggregata TaxID=2047720 RepID=A0A6L9MCI4_9HYPH|nr:hypothetical protein [Aurantimonas aggregata]NDV85525.1 hypothetical protein [Aurantimonas aggregata]